MASKPKTSIVLLLFSIAETGMEEVTNKVCNMKRGRETEKGSDIRSVIEELSFTIKTKLPKSKEDEGACHDSVQLKDNIGLTMAVLRQDIHQNIQRLDAIHDLQPGVYSNLVEILNKEKDEGNARKIDSCSRAFVWLTRALDFTMTMLRKLADEPGKAMEQAVEESYIATLKPWHGWISTAAYKVALKMVPDRKSLMTLLAMKDDNSDALTRDFKSMILLLSPLLNDAHTVMETYGLSNLKSR